MLPRVVTAIRPLPQAAVKSLAPNEEWIVKALERGRETERAEAERLLGDPQSQIDRAAICDTILRLLATRYKSAEEPRDDDAEKLRVANARAWLLYALPSAARDNAEAAAVLRDALDSAVELSKWARYWALVGQLRFEYCALTRDILDQLIASDREQLVILLALAKLAKDGDPKALQKLKEALLEDAQGLQWEALRAIRVVSLDDGDIIKRLCQFVDVGANSDLTYDAIQAASKVSPDSDHAKRVARTLANFVDRWSTYPGRDSMRLRATAVLGQIGRPSEAQVLLDQLPDDNPAIVRQAARALETCLGARSAVDRVLAEAARDQDRLGAYALALRWLEQRDEVVDQLAVVMTSGAPDLRDLARSLLSEVGGMAAMEKLRVQSNLMSQHAAFLKESEQHVQALFENSIRDANTGFQRSLLMDQVVFYAGMLLIGVSAVLALIHNGQLASDWVGTGSTGVLGVLYALFVGKPRVQVQRAVDHLMRLKIIFLGFLRQLHQADSAYIRRLLDDRSLNADDLKAFSSVIESATDKANIQLSRVTPAGDKCSIAHVENS